MDSIIKTEVTLNEEMVAKIVASETSKALAKIPEFMESMVKQMLFSRPKKNYSYDPEPPTMYETLVKKYLQPIIEKELADAAESFRPKLKEIAKKAFKSNVISNKEFEDRILAQMSKFSSKINFYVDN